MNWIVFLLLTGCEGDVEEEAEVVYQPVCTQPAEVRCFEESLLDLNLHAEVSAGLVENALDGDEIVSTIDATAGGFGASPNNPYIYVTFGQGGVDKVEINDEEAMESMDWDLALHRYRIRVNSGTSGPSCVGVAPLPDLKYPDIDADVLDGLTYVFDDFYTDSCSIIDDDSGLPGVPDVAMSDWWSYRSCIETTNVPFVLQLANGRHIKLKVASYYGEGQKECNQDGVAGEDGGQIVIRWQYL